MDETTLSRIVAEAESLRAVTEGIAGQDAPKEKSIEAVQLLANVLSDTHNPANVNWRRVRAAIEHENNLANHRITWLLLSQAGLLTAFATLYNKWLEATVIPSPERVVGVSTTTIKGLYSSVLPIPLVVLAAIGTFISVNIWLSLRDGALQNSRLTAWWYRSDFDEQAKLGGTRPAKQSPLDVDHPPIHLWHATERLFYGKSERPGWLRTESMPLYFAAVWCLLFIAVILPLWVSEATMLSAFSLGQQSAPWLAVLALGAALNAVIVRFRKERTRK